MSDDPPQDLFAIELAPGHEHAVDLGQRAAPVRDMMQDAEIEDGIVAGVRGADGRGVAHPQADARAPWRTPGLPPGGGVLLWLGVSVAVQR